MIASYRNREELLNKFSSKLIEDRFLTRQIVSFQANKNKPKYRWFKYKEGFSSNLVKYYIEKFNLQEKRILDPFAGIGTALFVASEYGCKSTGIELLPIGTYIMHHKSSLSNVNIEKLKETMNSLWDSIEEAKNYESHIKHIPITKGAFSEANEKLLNQYLSYSSSLDSDVCSTLNFAAFTVLEDISYTRKDGQYLRWDYRSDRELRQKFDKGKIIDFKTAVNSKLSEIIYDLTLPQENSFFAPKKRYYKGEISVIEGSCLYKLPEIKENSYDLIITSPPYANRYDYTRTYALELIYLGKDNEQIKDLRQQMLSCTVENKSKINQLREFYQSIGRLSNFEQVISVFESNEALSEVLDIFEEYRLEKKLNNNGVLRLIKNYFLEMCFVTFEMARVLDNKGKIVMVNDNVKYAGEEIPVDLILSDFAEKFGLTVKNIFVLPQKKGNSSQQMGKHGRTPLRKGVYLWQKN